MIRQYTHGVTPLVNTASVCLIWMILLQVKQVFCQTGALTVNHENGLYSTSSSVMGHFELTLDAAVAYRLSWRFNEANICTASVNGLNLLQSSLECDPSSHASGSQDRYYASNSKISGMTTGSELSLDLVYSMASAEESLRMDIYDSSGVVISNIVNITVQNCSGSSPGLVNAEVDESCDFMCNATAECRSEYESDGQIVVTCLDDATWLQSKNCTASPLPCPINASKCHGCCNSTGAELPGQVGDGQNVTVECCEGYEEDSLSPFMCEDGAEFTPTLTCVTVTTMETAYSSSVSVAEHTAVSGMESMTSAILEVQSTTDLDESNSNITNGDDMNPVTGYMSSSASVGVTSTTTFSDSTSTPSGTTTMSPGDIAGTVFACVDGTVIIVLSIVTAIGFGLKTVLFIACIVIASVFCLTGTLMSFLGSNGGSELNDVEKAGIGIACVGSVMAIGELIFQLVRGRDSSRQ